MSVTQKQVDAGQAIYTPRTLTIYDFVVLTVSNRFIWNCPTERLVEHYNNQITANHLDVGVGTGYYLDCCRFSSSKPRIALMDLNPDALSYAAERIARYQPETYLQNILEPITTEMAKFDSVGINYLLHCLPGTITTKAVVFDHLKAVMNPGGVLFGSTLLQGGVPRSYLAKRLMNFYNKKGVFSNKHDDLERLKKSLHERFGKVSLEVVGCAALFAARV